MVPFDSAECKECRGMPKNVVAPLAAYIDNQASLGLLDTELLRSATSLVFWDPRAAPAPGAGLEVDMSRNGASCISVKSRWRDKSVSDLVTSLAGRRMRFQLHFRPAVRSIF